MGSPRLDPGPSEWSAETETKLMEVRLPWEGQRLRFGRRPNATAQFKGSITTESPGVRLGSRLDYGRELGTGCEGREVRTGSQSLNGPLVAGPQPARSPSHRGGEGACNEGHGGQRWDRDRNGKVGSS